ncbi:fasciclin domain-containing protein [Cochleicola gelatinilyticus]|uniref:FAS1 domain-containing protein n=1 Tax=Cochleicola gelatinilyticus TaxID=1763537 RepID=A0A167F4I2_9FLAO|nr:fasciclin domain-containing protein [Cochleicola gelatinilyticus]OAB76183.1 hypothetical protein ULVI_14110 [Cochleicola gelatinilyticus]
MKRFFAFLFGFAVLGVSLSCKEKTTKPMPASEAVKTPVVNKVLIDTTLLSEENISESLYEKMNNISELKNFQQALKGTELQEQMQYKKGPFTIFALSNNVFGFEMVDSLRTQSINDSVVEELARQIIEEKITSIDLIRRLKKVKGALVLYSLSKENMNILRSDFDIFISTAKLKRARLGKTDIEASNGIIHIVDSVWNK